MKPKDILLQWVDAFNRADDELITLMQKFRWWDKAIDEIQELIPLLHDNDLERVKREIERRLTK